MVMEFNRVSHPFPGLKGSNGLSEPALSRYPIGYVQVLYGLESIGVPKGIRRHDRPANYPSIYPAI
jgi:hypothetical protein